MRQGEFDFNDAKAEANFRKHGVSFGEAQTVFGDARAITIYDSEHSAQEDRFVTIGLSALGNLLVVIHSDDEHEMRIISARRATRTEVRAYVER